MVRVIGSACPNVPAILSTVAGSKSETSLLAKQLLLSVASPYSPTVLLNPEHTGSLITSTAPANYSRHLADVKQYELKNHLGNVLATVSDKRTPVDASLAVEYYTPKVGNAAFYYPFGGLMPGLSDLGSNGHSFGFQSQERTDEVKGGRGNFIDFKFRGYDTQTGRFWSLDPLEKEYPWNSPYAFSENRVNDAIELEGLESFSIHGTASDPCTFDKMTDQDILVLTGNSTSSVNRDFSWESKNGFNNGFTNNQKDRKKAAMALAVYVIENKKKGEDISLVAHSHGGNVAIQAIRMIKSMLRKDGDDRKVNLVTIATPAYNGQNDPENPKNAGADSHTHYYSEYDGVQTIGANLMGEKDALRTYNHEGTTNIKVNDAQTRTIPDPSNPGMTKKVTGASAHPVKSHSIQARPELLKGK